MAKKSRPRQTRGARKPVLYFLLTFMTCLIVLGFLYSYTMSRFEIVMVVLQELTADLTYIIVSLFSDKIGCSENTLIFDGFAITIIAECVGLLEIVIYSAAVIAFPTGLRKKLVGIGFGIVIIYLFNVIRVIILLIAGSYSRRIFDFLHLYLWQVTLVIIIASVWIGWITLVVKREKARAVAVYP